MVHDPDPGPNTEVIKLWGLPPGGGRCWSSWGARIVCVRDIFILNETLAQHKTYFGRRFAWLTYFTYHLAPVLAPNYK
jgi:hypothetical protein